MSATPDTLFTGSYGGGLINDKFSLVVTGPRDNHTVTAARFVRFHAMKLSAGRTRRFKVEIDLHLNTLAASAKVHMWFSGDGWIEVSSEDAWQVGALLDFVPEWTAQEGRVYAADSDVLEAELTNLAGVLVDDADKILKAAV